MLQQSTQTVLPLLPMLQQPAFCVLADGSVSANHAAKYLAPARKESLPLWLGGAAELYETWDRQEALQLPVRMAGREVTATVQALSDGELFLLSDRDIGLAMSGDALTVAAQVLRKPLSDLVETAVLLADYADEGEDDAFRDQVSGLIRDLFRLARIGCNMADMERLRSDDYPMELNRLTLPEDLRELFIEMHDAAEAAGKDLQWRLPDKTVQFYGDIQLLERALLNLLSNAVKFSNGDTIYLSVDALPTAMLFRVRSSCSQKDAELLSSAFRRLEDRGMVPDVRWGMGLGLQLVQRVAALHRGAVAVETNNGFVTVTMSVSRKPPEKNGVRTGFRMDYAGGMQHSLLELSDVMPDSPYLTALY